MVLSRNRGEADRAGCTAARLVSPWNTPRACHHDRVHYGPETYGDAFADVYDDWYGDMTDLSACVATLHGLSLENRVLELGVGTGRIALPLAAAGAQVVGIDASPAMLERLTERDPHHTVEPHLGNMAGPLPDGPFQVVFAAYNTFFNLTTSDDQRSCLLEVRRCLATDGHLLIEAFVPDGHGPDRGIDARPTTDGVVLNIARRDPQAQIVVGQQVELSSETVRLRPWQIRYLSPDQLDEMAASAHLGLVTRWSDWAGTPFTQDSLRHVSVYAPH